MTSLEQQELAQANDYLAYWKPQLRLEHIDFQIVLMNPEESGNSLARCKVAPCYHQQKIQIIHPNDRSKGDEAFLRRDLEVAIVHELLHTKEFPWRDHPSVDEVFNKDKWLNKLHEDSLDAVAEALVRVRRGLLRR